MPSPLQDLLPHPIPSNANTRIALLAIRRMGAFGLRDAVTAQAFVAHFGQSFRRPLVLMRAFMAEIAATATQPMTIAPCCCPRTTESERALIETLVRARAAPCAAWMLLADQLGARDVAGALACAEAVSTAFADTGRPIS